MYTGDMINSLIAKVDKALNRSLPRTGNPFDDLCEAKTALADKMAEEIRDCGHESQECRDLWFMADRLQEQS